MVQIKWTKLAVEDLNEIHSYISRNSGRYARIQVLRLRMRTKILKTNPKSGKVVPEYHDTRYRELIEGNYRIIYKVIDETRVDILTIHHSARDLERRQLE